MRVQLIRVRLSDQTTLEMPENELVQVVTAGPGDAPKEGWHRLSDKGPALFGTTSKVRAAALAAGQHIVTFRGVVQVEGARRV